MAPAPLPRRCAPLALVLAAGCRPADPAAATQASVAAAALVTRAVALQAAGDPLGALTELRAAADLGPADPDVCADLARALTAAGELEAADELFRRAAGAAAPELLVEHGRVREELGDPAAARALYEAALARRPTLAAAHLRLAHLAERAGDGVAAGAALAEFERWAPLEAARDAARAAADARPGDPALLLDLARRELDLQRFAAARAGAEAVLAASPEDVPALLLAGAAARGEGELGTALERFAAAARAAPGDPAPHAELAWTHAGAGDGAAALAAMREARRRGASAFELGLLAREVGDLPRALAAFDEHLVYDREHAGARLAKAEVLAGAGQWPEAAQLFAEVLAREPDNEAARAGLAFAGARAAGAGGPR